MALMFIWPDGQVTGAEHWDALAFLIGAKPKESAYFPAGPPTKAGWDRLEALLAQHIETVTPPVSEAAEPELRLDEQAEAGLLDEEFKSAKPRRSRAPREA